jgi:hypothetical protein
MMATWKVYDYVDRRGENVIELWRAALPTRGRAKVDAKLRMLRQFGGQLPTTILADTENPQIKKLRITGRVNYRVLLCRGPVDTGQEFTLLNPVAEKDNKLPLGAVEDAARRRAVVLADPATRRVSHDFNS